MNPPEMIVIIVALVMIASIIKTVVAGPRRPLVPDNSDNSAETRWLREQVAELKERVKVLERIAIEKEDSLTKQIEELRDR
jgi:hypothetical protein